MALLKDIEDILPVQKERSSSIDARLTLIDTLHGKVMAHYFAKEKPSSCQNDFDEHLKYLQANLEELSRHWKAGAPQGDSERWSYVNEAPERIVGIVGPFKGPRARVGATIYETLELMSDLEHHPTLGDLSVLLYTLWVYWAHFRDYIDDPKDDLEAALDINLAKIAYHVGVECSGIRQWGHREFTRTKKSSKSKKTKAQKKREYIVQIFPHVKKKVAGVKVNLSIMAEAIKEDWGKFPPSDKDIKKAPGLTFIKETLLNEEQTKVEFEKVGGLWIIKM